MKTAIIICSIILLGLTANVYAQTKVSTETTLVFDKKQSGSPINRIELSDSKFSLKYDYKVDLVNNTRINDVFGVFLPKLINKPTFNFGIGLMKLGDGDRKDNVLLDLSAQKKFTSLTVDLEIGRAFCVETKPWDYIMVRTTQKLLTIEGGILSPDPLFTNSQKKLYGWISYHPEHYFVAVGNEISRNWVIAGTKKYDDFGALAFANYDRDNGNFWFRGQFGFTDVNQKFFEQNNYVTATSYLIVPPFFYKHFSPMSTKGKYAFKFDGRRVDKFDVYEVSFGRQFGKYGQLAVGATNENLSKERIGLLLEYFKEFTFKNFKATSELRYEQLSKKFYGFIVLAYTIK